jgi:hypothetical protein
MARLNVMTGLTTFEILGPRVIEVEQAEYVIDEDVAILRGPATLRSAVDELVPSR